MIHPLLEVKGLTHQYPGRGFVLKNASFSLNSLEKLALTGANGEGKTTLFHLLVGLIPCQQGDILGMNKKMTNEKDFVSLRQKVGLVFQDPDDQLFCPTVLEDVMFGPLNQGLKPAQAREVAVEQLQQLNLAHLQNRIAADLSGGEKRMVALAAVLVMKPTVLLLDEPTNALDKTAKAQLLTVLKALDQAMIVISHDQPFLDELTNGQLTLSSAELTKS